MSDKSCTLALFERTDAALAQLVEQRTENPCVPGSIPGGGNRTKKVTPCSARGYFYKDGQKCKKGRKKSATPAVQVIHLSCNLHS